jgi:hypothetical protein
MGDSLYYTGRRSADRRVGPRAGSAGRRAEDRERAAWRAFLDGCQALVLGRVLMGEGPGAVG